MPGFGRDSLDSEPIQISFEEEASRRVDARPGCCRLRRVAISLYESELARGAQSAGRLLDVSEVPAVYDGSSNPGDDCMRTAPIGMCLVLMLAGCGQDFIAAEHDPPGSQAESSTREWDRPDGWSARPPDGGTDGGRAAGGAEGGRFVPTDTRASGEITYEATPNDPGDRDGSSGRCSDGGLEACNGVDDDCDGVVDEGCPCAYRQKPRGVCGSATIGASNGECRRPETYQDDETRCDGLDNDCDGKVDEADACIEEGACVASGCELTQGPERGETHVAFHFECPSGRMLKAFPYERARRAANGCWVVECAGADGPVDDRICPP